MGPVLQRVARELCNRKNEKFHFNPRGWQPQVLLGTEVGPLARGGATGRRGRGQGEQ